MGDVKTWVLADGGSGEYVEKFEIASGELGVKVGASWSVKKRTLRGGLADGVDIIEVDNGALQFVVVPTRGMGIWRGAYRGTRLGWDAPVKGPVHPKFVNQLDRGGIGWLAGFDEWIVRCGLHSNGAPGVDAIRDNNGNLQEMTLPLHGRIANLPAHDVRVNVFSSPPHDIEIIGKVEESTLFFPGLELTATIRTGPGSNIMTIEDEVRNLRSQPAEMQMLYHCNFGPPLLGEGARFLAPIAQVAPRDEVAAKGMDHFETYPAPTPGVIEEAFFFEPAANNEGRTFAAIIGPTGDKACVFRFSKKELPWLTLWKNPAAESDGYVTGIEPATNLPNAKRFERENGRVVTIPPGGSYKIRLDVEVLEGTQAVSQLEEESRGVQGKPPIVHARPLRPFSPA